MYLRLKGDPVTALCVSASLLLGLGSLSAHAEFDWASVTLDNDIIVNSDSGYTNGVYFSLFDVRYDDKKSKSGLLTRPLAFLQSDNKHTINAYAFGQAMNTPTDITLANPPLDTLPYSGLLYVTNSFITFGDNRADRISTTLGIVGPASLAEPSQKTIHKLIGSDEPQGWDTQLDNELVFQFTRARLWRKPIADHQDLLFMTGAELGTLQSGISSSAIYRFGQHLHSGYSTPLLSHNRLANPAAIDGGWYGYAGLETRYTFNQVIADGNTFEDSRSVDYRKLTVGVTFGFAYSWSDYSLSIALRDTSVASERFNNAEDDLTRYGTFTLGKRL